MNLLVAIDFSEITEAVIDHTRTLASALKAEVFLLHVIAPSTPVLDIETDPGTVHPLDAAEILPGATVTENRTHLQLHELAEKLRLNGISVSAHLAYNDEVDAIIKAAETFEAGMIVLGSHGHGAFYHLLIGSVSEGVIRKATCPVLIVPSGRK